MTEWRGKRVVGVSGVLVLDGLPWEVRCYGLPPTGCHGLLQVSRSCCRSQAQSRPTSSHMRISDSPTRTCSCQSKYAPNPNPNSAAANPSTHLTLTLIVQLQSKYATPRPVCSH